MIILQTGYLLITKFVTNFGESLSLVMFFVTFAVTISVFHQFWWQFVWVFCEAFSESAYLVMWSIMWLTFRHIWWNNNHHFRHFFSPNLWEHQIHHQIWRRIHFTFPVCQDKSWEDRTEHANTRRRKEDWMPKRQESVNLSYVKVEPARRNASWRQFWFQIED